MIYVCPLSQVDHAVATHKPSHLVSLLDPNAMIDTPDNIVPHFHHKVSVNDITEHCDDMTAPDIGHVTGIIDFVTAWPREAPLLIHCWAGISRSTASAFITLCIHNETVSEHLLAQRIRNLAPHAQPNKRIVALADDLLGRNGRMVDAVAAIGPGQIDGFEGVLFGIPLKDET